MATAKYFITGPHAGQAITSLQQTSSAGGEGGLYAISNTFDASQTYSETVGGANVSTAGTGLDATDLAEVLLIPAHTYILNVFVTVITAEGATQVVDIGLTGVSATAFFDDANVNATAGTTVHAGAVGTYGIGAGGHYLSTADTIDLLAVTNDYGVGKVRITALCFSPVV